MRRYRREVVTFVVPAVFVMLLVGGLLGVILIESRAREVERVRIRAVLCHELEKVKDVQRDDLRQRIAEGQNYLQINPNGDHGIPPELVLRGIERNTKSLARLRPIDCEEFANVNDIQLEGAPGWTSST